MKQVQLVIDIEKNLIEIKKRIAMAANKNGHKAENVKLVVVSKSVDIEIANRAYSCGVRDFAENRVQELIKKSTAIPDATWHMIGRLQTNKVKDVVGRANLIHSLDRWSLAEAINRRAETNNIVVDTLLQVNISGEQQKAGIDSSETEDFLKSLSELKMLRIKGFMTIAPQVDNPEETRPVFKKLKELFEFCKGRAYQNVDLKYLSMGMSQDFEIAVEEGANIIRIGSAVFKESN
jgi:pyridoxal phosphate enzyme (YggS family)